MVENEIVARIGPGLLLLVGVAKDDAAAKADRLADRVHGLRIFNDANGRLNLALKDFRMNGEPDAPLEREVLAVSNFTVYGDADAGRRPSFARSAPFEVAELRFEDFVDSLRKKGVDVQTGVFGADMKVALVNDGPVTLVVDA